MSYLGPFCGGKLLLFDTTHESIEKQGLLAPVKGRCMKSDAEKLRAVVEMKCSREFSAAVWG